MAQWRRLAGSPRLPPSGLSPALGMQHPAPGGETEAGAQRVGCAWVGIASLWHRISFGGMPPRRRLGYHAECSHTPRPLPPLSHRPVNRSLSPIAPCCRQSSPCALTLFSQQSGGIRQWIYPQHSLTHSLAHSLTHCARNKQTKTKTVVIHITQPDLWQSPRSFRNAFVRCRRRVVSRRRPGHRPRPSHTVRAEAFAPEASQEACSARGRRRPARHRQAVDVRVPQGRGHGGGCAQGKERRMGHVPGPALPAVRTSPPLERDILLVC